MVELQNPERDPARVKGKPLTQNPLEPFRIDPEDLDIHILHRHPGEEIPDRPTHHQGPPPLPARQPRDRPDRIRKGGRQQREVRVGMGNNDIHGRSH